MSPVTRLARAKVRRMEIIGRKCQGLIAREFWLFGELVTPLCVVFLSDDRGDKWKLYLYDEDNTWKIEKTDENPNDFEGDNEFQYPLTYLLEKFPLKGQVIESFREWDAGSSAKAEIRFSSGVSLEFDHDYRSEAQSVVMKESR